MYSVIYSKHCIDILDVLDLDTQETKSTDERKTFSLFVLFIYFWRMKTSGKETSITDSQFSNKPINRLQLCYVYIYIPGDKDNPVRHS